MSGWGFGGVAGAALGLIVFEVLLTSSQNSASGASQVAGLLGVPGRLASSWMDPTVPLIPNRATSSASASSSASSTSSASKPAAPPKIPLVLGNYR